MRVGPTADVSGWLLSVAEVLPLPHLAGPPYTLAEAVAELGAHAQTTDASGWDRKFSPGRRSSLQEEIKAQSAVLGSRLGTRLAPLLDDLRDDSDPADTVAAAAQFSRAWHSAAAITDAFGDLCDKAKTVGATSHALRRLSAIIASQVGPAAHDSFSLLSDAANVLVDTEEHLARLRHTPFPEQLTEARRLELATSTLLAAPVGRIVVWTAYYRARLRDVREAAGPMTFLQADWALPNAFDLRLEDFPECAELREIREEARWLDDAHTESLKPENRLVLVRIELGERQFAGAVEEARRRVDAVLSITVDAGGASWRNAGVAAVLLDGKVRRSSFGLDLRPAPTLEDDSYGMGATAEILSSVAEQLNDALSRGPMPEPLVEALTTLREARMTDHRDVHFGGVRPVAPRIATALEDHALELLASLLKVEAEDMAKALQKRESLNHASSRVCTQLIAPLAETWSREPHTGRDALARAIITHSPAGTFVSIHKAVELQNEIRALPMSDLERADFEDAIAVCTDPVRERQLLDGACLHTDLLKKRLRRVRNAVNHGLPLDDVTLGSIREYADHTSRTALSLALTWFKNGDPGAVLLQREEDAWADRMDRIARGESWATASAQSAAEIEE